MPPTFVPDSPWTSERGSTLDRVSMIASAPRYSSMSRFCFSPMNVIEPAGICLLLLVGGWWRDRQAVDQFEEGDKQALLAYHRGYLHESFW